VELLLDADDSAANFLTRKLGNLFGFKFDVPSRDRKDSLVNPQTCTSASCHAGAALADDNITIFDNLAAKQLNAKAFACAIASVSTGTTGLCMCHSVLLKLPAVAHFGV
jgi:hypothetical protein